MRTSLDETIPIEMLQTAEYGVFVMGTDASRRKRMAQILNSIRDKALWCHWTDSSGKSDPPPDFFSDKFRLMMEIMRIDDHEFVEGKHKVNHQKMLEGKMLKELKSRTELLPELTNAIVFIDTVTDLPSEEDHNYSRYVSCFHRVVGEHILSIPIYRKNHPDMELVFLIFDESSAYGELSPNMEKKEFKAGDDIEVKPHFWWFDRNIIKILNDSDIDYVIWFAPYKDNRVDLWFPSIVVFSPSDIPRIDDYDADRMISLEE